MVARATLIQNCLVRHLLLLAAQGLLALSLVSGATGCGHAHDEMAPRTVNNEVVRPTEPGEAVEPEREVLAVDRTPAVDPPATARPRLSQTVTLGQGTESQYTPSAP